MAAAVARRPGGTVTATQPTAAAKEGAFRFLESQRVETGRVAEAVYETAALDCARHELAFVSVDQTDLTFIDRKGVRGLGPSHTRECRSLCSINFMNSLALDRDGVPIGVIDQQWWLRSEERKLWGKGDRRPPQGRESWQWVRAIEAVHNRLSKIAPSTRPWFVMDRGADFHGTLVHAVEEGLLVTIRSCHNRRVKRNGTKRWLKSTLARQPVLGHVKAQVPRGPGQLARLACFEIRALRASVRLSFKPHREVWSMLSCVRLREVGTVPSGQAPIEWRLLSTHPVDNLEHAKLILKSYTLRWRIEEFHKTWKSGACKVESSQLRSLDAIVRWATILSAVAARIERLKLLSRQQPDIDALEEFSQDELDAAIVLSETKHFEVGAKMTLHDAVRLVALVGGYMGRTRDGPPGSITIRRGLDLVLPAATAIAATRRSG